MLTIRPAQMEALRATLKQQFLRSTAAELPGRFPDRMSRWSEAELRELIQSGVEDAGRFGITNPAHLARWIELMVIYGADFHRRKGDSRLQEILSNPRMAGWERMGELEYHLRKSEGSR